MRPDTGQSDGHCDSEQHRAAGEPELDDGFFEVHSGRHSSHLDSHERGEGTRCRIIDW